MVDKLATIKAEPIAVSVASATQALKQKSLGLRQNKQKLHTPSTKQRHTMQHFKCVTDCHHNTAHVQNKRANAHIILKSTWKDKTGLHEETPPAGCREVLTPNTLRNRDHIASTALSPAVLDYRRIQPLKSLFVAIIPTMALDCQKLCKAKFGELSAIT